MATIFEKHFNFTARFYAKGNYDGAPDHTLVSLTISTATDGVITGLSKNEPTKIEFKVDGSATLPDRVRVIALQSFAPDNTQRYPVNIFRGRTENHITDAGATTISGILKNPSQKAQAGTITTISFHVDNTLINLGETYYFQIIVADSTNNKYTTYITGELTVIEPTPQPIAPDLAHQDLNNYNLTSAGNCIAMPPERLKSEIEFDITTYNAAVTAFYGTGDFNTYFQDVFVQIKDGTTVLQSGSFSGGDISFVSGGMIRTFTYNFRLKHDASDDWQGKTLTLTWELRMFYPASVTGRQQDHTDHLYLNQTIVCGTLTPTDGIIMTMQDQDGNEISSLCEVTEITVTVQGTNGKNLIALIDSFQYSANKILEEESYISPQGLAQLSNNTLFAVDTVFAGGGATFKILVSELQINIPYRVYSLALLP